MIPTAFERQWERFRDKLDNQQLINLSVLVRAWWLDAKGKQGVQHIFIVTPEPKAAVFVFVWNGVVHLVAGHWLRKGEPTADLMALIRCDIDRIRGGKEGLL